MPSGLGIVATAEGDEKEALRRNRFSSQAFCGRVHKWRGLKTSRWLDEWQLALMKLLVQKST
jgi:hypothetical protein